MVHDEIRDRLLEATLPQVAFDGWVDRSLRQGATDAGLPPETLARVFPGGAIQMIEHWSARSDRRMMAAMDKLDLAGMGVGHRVAAAVRLRLEVCLPYREAVRRALAVLAIPTNGLVAARLTYDTVNAIWYAAGDTATDFSYYTKRALLVPVYGSTVLFWLDDESEEFADTWAFLDRRIGDLMQIAKIQTRLQQGPRFRLRWRGRWRPGARRRPA
jgi:ubiquinone biosynthesis protein COQ9